MRVYTHGTMVEIARENLDLALKCQETVDTLRKTLENLKGNDADYFRAQELRPIERKLSNYCVVTIVFAALATEAYIYDYAARKLTDKFVESHLDKLDTISKCVVVTKLVTGKDFPKDGNAFRALKQLIRNRNYIVHSKSTDFLKIEGGVDLTGELPEGFLESIRSDRAKKLLDFFNDSDSILNSAQEAILALVELAAVIESFDPDEPASFHLHLDPGL